MDVINVKTDLLSLIDKLATEKSSGARLNRTKCNAAESQTPSGCCCKSLDWANKRLLYKDAMTIPFKVGVRVVHNKIDDCQGALVGD